MRKLFLFLIVMLAVGSVKAQWSIFPEVGMTAIKPEGGAPWSPRAKFGVGAAYEFIPGFFSVKSGLYYTQRGHKDSYFYWDYQQDTETAYMKGFGYEVSRGFLQIPLLANLSLPLNEDILLNLAVGGYVAPVLHHSWSYGGHYSYYTPGDYQHGPSYGYDHGYSYGMYGGGGYGYMGQYGFDDVARFDWGLSLQAGIEVKNVLVNVGYDVAMGKEWAGDDISAKYHTISLSVGYKFRLGGLKK